MKNQNHVSTGPSFFLKPEQICEPVACIRDYLAIDELRLPAYMGIESVDAIFQRNPMTDQTLVDQPAENEVAVSASAAKRVAKILSTEPDMTALRVSVEGGGCSGFSYKFDLARSATDEDIVIERDGAQVIIDPVSIMYMGGSVIDFVDDLMGQSFQIKNPNATASCGCGTSFSM